MVLFRRQLGHDLIVTWHWRIIKIQTATIDLEKESIEHQSWSSAEFYWSHDFDKHILILGRTKATNFEQQVKLLEKSQEDTFLMLLQIFFKGFD